MTWMRAREANPLDAGHVVDGFEEPREIAGGIVGRLVMVHDLPEQLYFRMPAGGRVADFGEDVGFGPHALMAARIGHDAEAAKFVAPLDDGDIRLHRVGASRDAERERDV